MAPLPPAQVYFGEVSLSGAVRPVAHAGARLKEAQKLGFADAVIPPLRDAPASGREVASLADLVALIAASARAGKHAPAD
jgi:DNA repair protein RadA/Sms